MNSTPIAVRTRDALRERHQLSPLARRHAGGRLVHQQQLRLVGERDRQLEPLDVAIGDLAAQPIRLVRHADELQQLEQPRLGAAAPPNDGVGHSSSAMRQQRHLHVLGERHRQERRRDLERAADAEPPDLRAAQMLGATPENG